MEYPIHKQPRFWYVVATIAILATLAVMAVWRDDQTVRIIGLIDLVIWGFVIALWHDIASMRREIKRLRGE
jgi:uncharacterized membrane protein